MADIWCREIVPDSTARLAEQLWGQSVPRDLKCELRTSDHSTGMHRAAGKGGNISWAVEEPREFIVDAKQTPPNALPPEGGSDG